MGLFFKKIHFFFYFFKNFVLHVCFRSRSRSPSESKRLPDELKQHLDFSLVDTEGMSEAQLREIPYTVVQTAAKPVKVKTSPSNRRRAHRSSRRSLKR